MRGEVMRASIGYKQEDHAAIAEAEAECGAKMAQYRQTLAEKAVLYDQLHASTKQLINRDDIIIKNEAEIIRLKYEIDISKLEVQQKREVLLELEAELEKEKSHYKSLKVEIIRLEKKAGYLG